MKSSLLGFACILSFTVQALESEHQLKNDSPTVGFEVVALSVGWQKVLPTTKMIESKVKNVIFFI